MPKSDPATAFWFVFWVGVVALVYFWLSHRPAGNETPTRYALIRAWLVAWFREASRNRYAGLLIMSNEDDEEPAESSETEPESGPKRNTETSETSHQDARNTPETAAFGETAFTVIAKLHAAGVFRDKFGETEALELIFGVKAGSSRKYKEVQAELKRAQTIITTPPERYRKLDEHSRPMLVTKAAEK